MCQTFLITFQQTDIKIAWPRLRNDQDSASIFRTGNYVAMAPKYLEMVKEICPKYANLNWTLLCQIRTVCVCIRQNVAPYIIFWCRNIVCALPIKKTLIVFFRLIEGWIDFLKNILCKAFDYLFYVHASQ